MPSLSWLPKAWDKRVSLFNAKNPLTSLFIKGLTSSVLLIIGSIGVAWGFRWFFILLKPLGLWVITTLAYSVLGVTLGFLCSLTLWSFLYPVYKYYYWTSKDAYEKIKAIMGCVFGCGATALYSITLIEIFQEDNKTKLIWVIRAFKGFLYVNFKTTRTKTKQRQRLKQQYQ